MDRVITCQNSPDSKFIYRRYMTLSQAEQGIKKLLRENPSYLWKQDTSLFGGRIVTPEGTVYQVE